MTGTTISGIYTSGVTLTTYNPVYFTGSINAGTGNALTGPSGTLWTVVNSGQIASTAASTYGVFLASGGTVTNQSGGSITGQNGAVGIQGAAGTVINSGQLYGAGNNAGTGVFLGDGGLVANTSATAIIKGSGAGIYGTGDSTTVTNLGSIIGFGPLNGGQSTADGINLAEAGSVTNGQAGTALGYIYGYDNGISIDGPTLGSTSLGAGTVANYGSIVGHTQFGVELREGGALVNGTNADSAAYIYGGEYGVYFNFANIVNAPNLPGTLTNYGTIKSSGTGVELASGGQVTNASGALISGGYGVQAAGQFGATGTITNAGVITGTGANQVAVSLSGAGDRLIIDPGAVFNGIVVGSTGALELAAGASPGSMSGLGDQFSGEYQDFAQITIDANATWALTGANVVWSGATLTNAGTLNLGSGTLSATGDVVNNGTILIGASTLTVANLGGTGRVDVAATSTLATQGSVGAGQTLVFDGRAGEIDLTPISFSGTILGFQQGATIELTGVTDATQAEIVNLDTLQVDRGGNPSILIDLDSNQNYTGVTFSVGTDAGDTFNTITTDLACFAGGTRIDTPAGPVPVEALREGSLVLTAGGAARPVSWIGFRAIDPRRHADPAAVRPVRIEAGAFADGVPRHPVRLSPDHAVLIHDVLVPVRLLVNGATIVREDECRSVTYYHVELSSHDVLLTEGLAAESYLDTGNRGMFENAGLPLTLHPNPGHRAPGAGDYQARREAESCVAFVADAGRVAPMWHALADRACALGYLLPEVTTTNDAAPRLELDGVPLSPVAARDGCFVFVLPATGGEVRLVSRAVTPDALRPWMEDRRSLGLMVRRMTLRRGSEVEVIPLDHPCLGRGWWALETQGTGHARWTDGDAALHLDPGGPVVLEIECGTMPAYILPAAQDEPKPVADRHAAA
jgi:Hint domain